MEHNRNSKTFNFLDISDYVFYLSELIIDTIQKKERIEFYLKDIENIIVESFEKPTFIFSKLIFGFFEK